MKILKHKTDLKKLSEELEMGIKQHFNIQFQVKNKKVLPLATNFDESLIKMTDIVLKTLEEVKD